jgi:hypothetical protein
MPLVVLLPPLAVELMNISSAGALTQLSSA